MKQVIRPDSCKLLYNSLLVIPNACNTNIPASRLKTDVLLNKPSLQIHTRCLRYGTTQSIQWNYKDPSWYVKDAVLSRHISINAGEKEIYVGVVELCYAIMKLYIAGKIIDREKTIGLIDKVLLGTKPSFKYIVNTYMERIHLYSLKDIDDMSIFEILIDQVLNNHKEYVEVKLDTITILSKIDELICHNDNGGKV